MHGFNNSPAMPPADANFRVFKTSGSFQLPNANYLLFDITGAGSGGGAIDSAAQGTYYPGGGGGARNRVLLTKNDFKAGQIVPVVVGAGGASRTVAASGTAVGLSGGTSSVGSNAVGFLHKAFGGISCGLGGYGGAGIYTSGNTDGTGGLPNVRLSYSTAGTSPNQFNVVATHDFGGGNYLNLSGSNYIGNAIYGGGCSWASGLGAQGLGHTLYGGGCGGGGGSYNSGKSSTYPDGTYVSTRDKDGIIGSLLFGSGNGGIGNHDGTRVLTDTDGGYPGGGGGSVGVPGVRSGFGADGIVIIYWW